MSWEYDYVHWTWKDKTGATTECCKVRNEQIHENIGHDGEWRVLKRYNLAPSQLEINRLVHDGYRGFRKMWTHSTDAELNLSYRSDRVIHISLCIWISNRKHYVSLKDLPSYFMILKELGTRLYIYIVVEGESYHCVWLPPINLNHTTACWLNSQIFYLCK
jgi:hypothetical protein